MISNELILDFYKTYNIPKVNDYKYFGFYLWVNNEPYPAFTVERFNELLTVLWSRQFDMNFDNDNLDLESLIDIRSKSYMEIVIRYLTKYKEDFETHQLNLEIKEIFKE